MRVTQHLKNISKKYKFVQNEFLIILIFFLVKLYLQDFDSTIIYRKSLSLYANNISRMTNFKFNAQVLASNFIIVAGCL
jgi:hypothetical protein